jgi:hypothetical protein
MVEELMVASLVTVIVRVGPSKDHPAVSPVFAMVSVCAIPFPEKDNKSSKLKKGITGLMPGICLLFI